MSLKGASPLLLSSITEPLAQARAARDLSGPVSRAPGGRMSQTRLRRRRAPGAGRRGCRSGPSAARQRRVRGAVDGPRSKGAGRGSQAAAVTWERFARGARAVPPLSPARPRCVRDRWVARTRARRRGRGHRRRVHGCRGSASACGPRLQTARELHNAVATAEVRVRARHRYLQKTRVQRHSLRGPTRHSARGIRSRYAITRRSGAARVRRQPQTPRHRTDCSIVTTTRRPPRLTGARPSHAASPRPEDHLN